MQVVCIEDKPVKCEDESFPQPKYGETYTVSFHGIGKCGCGLSCFVAYKFVEMGEKYYYNTNRFVIVGEADETQMERNYKRKPEFIGFHLAINRVGKVELTNK